MNPPSPKALEIADMSLFGQQKVTHTRAPWKVITALNNRERRTIAFQASGEYLMSHIADVMELVQDSRDLNEDEPDEEMLSTIEAQIKAIAEELIHQSEGQRVGVLMTKKERSLSIQRRRDTTDDNDRFFIYR